MISPMEKLPIKASVGSTVKISSKHNCPTKASDEIE
jgi:hypothetical protein